MSAIDESYLDSQRVSSVLRKPVLEAAIEVVDPNRGSTGLDLACGTGTMTFLLADWVGDRGHVTGLDVSPQFLDYARSVASSSGLSGSVEFKQGSAQRLPFGDASFDWTWSVDFVGYGTSNTGELINEMARVVRPGGKVAVMAWASERLLPGYPLLEAKLAATRSGLAPFRTGMPESLHLSRNLGWFRRAGLRDPQARAIAGSAHAPLSDDLRAALIDLLKMRWMNVESELTAEELAEYRRLCNPDSPDFLLDHPDYYAFFTYSLFWGEVRDRD